MEHSGIGMNTGIDAPVCELCSHSLEKRYLVATKKCGIVDRDQESIFLDVLSLIVHYDLGYFND